jgi:4-amino-4-deoxy-L-arabinose transferase-like glycosyltransferase
MGPVYALVLGLLALRLIYLAWFCPYGLVEDEAQYWDWSRHLDLSYYTKGPGIAWTIAAGRAVFGDSPLAVRAPAALFAALGTLGVALLARACSGGDRRVAFFAACAYQLAPIIQATGFLGTIDGPYCACWAWACWAAWRAMMRGSGWSWLALGLLVGVGFLYKYTILLLPPGLILFALVMRGELRPHRRWPFWFAGGLVVMLLAMSPVLIWNQRFGWPTLAHLLGHLGRVETLPTLAQPAGEAGVAWRKPFSPFWSVEFIAGQLAMVGPLLVLGVIAAVDAIRRRGVLLASWPGRAMLICAAAPILLFYLAICAFTEPEGNWPMAAYVTLLPLAGWSAAEGLSEQRRRVAQWLADPSRPRAGIFRAKPELWPQVLWHWSLGYGLVAGVGMLALALLAMVPGVGAYVPIGRLNGGVAMAQRIDAIRTQANFPADRPPMIVAVHYGQASQLAFYLPERPITFCASSHLGGRPTNHDFWPQTNLENPALLGRDAVLVGGQAAMWQRVFERVEPLGLLAGVERKGIEAYIGRGYRGFQAEAAAPRP